MRFKSTAKQLIKSTTYWTLPEGIRDTGLFLYRHFRTSPDNYGLDKKIISELAEENINLKDCHRGERCFILATGPSIQKQDLTLLKNEICISVSNFFVHPDYKKIKPLYHCIAPYHKPITEEAFQAWLLEIDQSLGDSSLFLALKDLPLVPQNKSFATRKTYYLDFGGTWDKINDVQDIDLSKPLPPIQSVPVMALMAAIYMGFEKIYLLGCDHDWILHIGESKHFYDEEKHVLNQKGYSEWSVKDLEYYCQSYVNLWRNYKKILSISTKNSQSIINLTQGGLLDVFPREEYDNIFRKDS